VTAYSEALVEHVRANIVVRRNARGGRSAAEHLIAALRCVYRHAMADGHTAATYGFPRFPMVSASPAARTAR
jgi:hypothetical protein